jgi:hypothetical protein
MNINPRPHYNYLLIHFIYVTITYKLVIHCFLHYTNLVQIISKHNYVQKKFDMHFISS